LRLAHIHQGVAESTVDEIGIEREAALELGDGGVVPAFFPPACKFAAAQCGFRSLRMA
jgi:hypothetical protein